MSAVKFPVTRYSVGLEESRPERAELHAVKPA
jgi:hypothetical protein